LFLVHSDGVLSLPQERVLGEPTHAIQPVQSVAQLNDDISKTYILFELVGKLILRGVLPVLIFPLGNQNRVHILLPAILMA
jgi:hypothetical protein